LAVLGAHFTLAKIRRLPQLWQYCGKKEAIMWRDSGRGFLLVSAVAMALAACSKSGQGGVPSADAVAGSTAPSLSTTASAEAAPGGEPAGLGGRVAIPVSLPKMAYVFDYSFRLPGKDIPTLQQKHADMCEAMGSYNCQIVSLTGSGEEGEYQTGKLELSVVSDRARGFGAQLAAAATSAGGERVAANIQGEDVSKQMIDTEARLRSRVALRDRLLDVVKTRKGTVAELVEAERNVAAVNEEIDQATSWLKEMKGRVAYSRVVVNYESASPIAGSFLAPVRAAFGSLGAILGGLAAVLIWLLAIGGPIAALVWGFRRVQRRWRPTEIEA
jgi:hypothetical protein